MKRLSGIAFVILVAAFLAQGGRAVPPPPRIDRVVVLDLASSGSAVVAVGERGTILTSRDGGLGWTAIPPVTSRTLTALAFDTAQTGVAVGHGGTILVSHDGGQRWEAVEAAAAGSDSLLGVTAVAPGHFVACGAYGLLLDSVDGGKSWTRRTVIDESFDRHLYRLLVLAADRWLLVGESGTIALSSDGGVRWSALPSPYPGSFFGAVQTEAGTVLAFGMRGRVFRSADPAHGWTEVESGTQSAFNNGLRLPDGSLALVGNGGLIALSDDDGRTLRRQDSGRGDDLTQLAPTGDGGTIVAGLHGLSRLPPTGRHAERTQP